MEGELFSLDATTRSLLSSTLARLKKTIRFRSWPLIDAPDGTIISGIVGVLALPNLQTIEIVPKTKPGEDWVGALLTLLLGTDRIDAAGYRKAGLAAQNTKILPALAAIYASRLMHALRREGPIVILRRYSRVASALKGKLDATAWLRHSLREPHRFPTESVVLTKNNDFARALAFVAHMLAPFAMSTSVKYSLLSAQSMLASGTPSAEWLTTGVEFRRIPAQWSGYESAWSIAAALLRGRTPLGAVGNWRGISIVIEVWPLLERLLDRSLRAACAAFAADGVTVSVLEKPNRKLFLRASTESDRDSRYVVPDGVLGIDAATRVVFDAKYKKRGAADWPSREDIYQVYSSCAAFGAQLGVLVYPDEFEPVCWTVETTSDGPPMKVAAIGLGLFSYTAGAGDRKRGQAIRDLVVSAGCVVSP